MCMHVFNTCAIAETLRSWEAKTNTSCKKSSKGKVRKSSDLEASSEMTIESYIYIYIWILPNRDCDITHQPFRSMEATTALHKAIEDVTVLLNGNEGRPRCQRFVSILHTRRPPRVPLQCSRFLLFDKRLSHNEWSYAHSEKKKKETV